MNTWSTLDECVRYLQAKESCHHSAVLQEQIEAMNCTPVGAKVYLPNIIVRAFEYFATSRADALRTHLKTHSEESQTNATNLTFPALIQVLYGDI